MTRKYVRMSTRVVLDHGYLDVIESWGSDERVIEAARMSTGKGFLGWGLSGICSRCQGKKTYVVWGDSEHDGDFDDPNRPCPACHGTGRVVVLVKEAEKLLVAGLLNTLTPFEMAGMIIEVKAPIFVFREWHRHRVPFSYNEMSARYTPLPDENYIPTVERLMINSKTNKQAGTAKDAKTLTEQAAERFQGELRDIYRTAETIYQNALKAGVPKELARVHLPVGRYSRMRASSNLRGWLNFLALRSDTNPGAQWEIRQYGNALHAALAEKFPRTLALYDDLGRAP